MISDARLFANTTLIRVISLQEGRYVIICMERTAAAPFYSILYEDKI